ncbi:MAG: tRNA (adenosine(37)-N6)-threonylcarbamoyltransferase complex ATPase subunit type 1 TsaE [Candidatus Omnitrophica bacterium]|nr:tRNA (adenosine(37)-N6)-threonylcarbamoyltransferase complex ATPase subunit type 1 TsaE [Candidatus Omnitrophota bacterium]
MLKKKLIPKVSFISNSEDETILCAQRLAGQLKAGDIVLLQGDLGAGKTTFVKGLARAFKVSPQKVNSPTFVLMNYYKGKLAIYHFDLYRLGDPKEVDTVDFDEYFYGEGISLIEWPERLGEYKPKQYYLVEFQHKGEQKRKICISCPSKHQPKSSH